MANTKASELTIITSTLNTNTINEKTSAAGVTIDSALVKDGGISLSAGASLLADHIDEKTSAHGLAIDGVLLKDNCIGCGSSAAIITNYPINAVIGNAYWRIASDGKIVYSADETAGTAGGYCPDGGYGVNYTASGSGSGRQARITGINGKTSSGGSTVYVNGSGDLGTSTSIREAKTNINENIDTSIIYNVTPITFNYRVWDRDTGYSQTDVESFLCAGMIAEDVYAIDSNFTFEVDNKLSGIRYERFIPYLIKAVQEQKVVIDQLKSEIEFLKNT